MDFPTLSPSPDTILKVNCVGALREIVMRDVCTGEYVSSTLLDDADRPRWIKHLYALIEQLGDGETTTHETEKPKLRLCKDCAYCDLGANSSPPPYWPHGPALHYKCRLPPVEIDLVSGNIIAPMPAKCHEMRGVDGACGPDGRLFSARGKE